MGSTNNQGGGSAGIEYGTKWMFWGNGGGQRRAITTRRWAASTNSYARDGQRSGGFGYFPTRGFVSFDYVYDNAGTGYLSIRPKKMAEIVYLNPRRHSVRFNAGLRDLGSFINGAQFSLQYNDYRHDEIDAGTDVVNTLFINKTSFIAAILTRSAKAVLGEFGFWGLHRD